MIKQAIQKHEQDSLDPLQFAYRVGRGVKDAILMLLNCLYHHFESPQTRAKLLFIDFSSAFNTIQPHLSTEKLVFEFILDPNIIGWILVFYDG